jgi:hypothetical protein
VLDNVEKDRDEDKDTEEKGEEKGGEEREEIEKENDVYKQLNNSNDDHHESETTQHEGAEIGIEGSGITGTKSSTITPQRETNMITTPPTVVESGTGSVPGTGAVSGAGAGTEARTGSRAGSGNGAVFGLELLEEESV